jgi:hypothetical protein
VLPLPALVLALVLARQGIPASECAEQREQRLRELAETSPGWTLARSRHYFVLAQDADASTREQVGRRADAMREEVERVLLAPILGSPPLAPGAIAPPEVPSVIALYRDQASYGRGGGSAASVGWWDRVASTLHVPDVTGLHGRGELWRGLQSVVVAELLDVRLREPLLSPWFLHGHQDYFAGYRYAHGRWRAEPHPGRLGVVRQLVREQNFVPLRELVEFGARDYAGWNEYSVAGGEVWAQGWSLVWFLRHGDRSRGWQRRWSDVPRRYLAEWRCSRDPELANAFAWDGVDFDELERAWCAHVLEVR